MADLLCEIIFVFGFVVLKEGMMPKAEQVYLFIVLFNDFMLP
jgi:hypothetical protein